MKTFQYTITDEVGIHARPAGALAKQVAQYDSKVTLVKEGKTADAGRLLGIMGLGVKKGDTITVQVDGKDEEQAAGQLETFFRENL